MEKKTLKKWNIVRDTKRNNANNMHAIKREEVKKNIRKEARRCYKQSYTQGSTRLQLNMDRIHQVSIFKKTYLKNLNI